MTRNLLLIILLFLLLVFAGCRSEAETPPPPTAASLAPSGNSLVAPTLPPPAVAKVDRVTPQPTDGPRPAETAIATNTAEPTATPLPTLEPTATSIPPTPTAEPPTATPEPSPTPLPTPTPEPLYPDWLGYLNRFRAMGNVAPLSEVAALTLGSKLHSQYMVANDAAISHKEDPALPFYDPAGDQAARNGNVFATSMVEADYNWGINFWVSAPFHLVPMLAPRLERVGYGDYNEAGGDVSMAAVLDVRSQRNTAVDVVNYPLFFPADGETTWIGRHNLFEWPDPLTSCPGYSRPSGPPIVVQLGNGTLTPTVYGHVLMQGDQPVESCLFDESTYHNPDVWAEKTGRQILNSQDAVVIMPRYPLIADQTYTVQLDANGQRYQWSFKTRASANQ